MRAKTPLWGQLGRYWFVDSWDDMSHQVSVDPSDHTRVHFCHLEEGRNLGVPSSTFDKHDITHPPVIVLFNDHGHPCFDVQEQWVAVTGRAVTTE